MRQTWIVATALLIGVGCVETATAVWVDSTAHYVRRGYHRNVLWPWPYVCPDRVAVREPFCIMVNNGWRRQNLLGPHHFNADATKLTSILIDAWPDLQKDYPALRPAKLEDLSRVTNVVPYHPGAIAAFKTRNMWSAKNAEADKKIM